MVNSKTSYNDRIHLILDSIELRPFFNIQTWKGIFSVIQEWAMILIAAFFVKLIFIGASISLLSFLLVQGISL